MLFIDIGNTRVKIAKDQHPLQTRYAYHDDLSSVFAVIQTSDIQRILLTSGRSTAAQRSLAAIVAFAEQHHVSVDTVSVQPTLLAINYDDPTQFGADRFLNLLAAKARYQRGFCVVSCGTAITLDFFTDRHIGGMIAPGIHSAKQLLAEKTGLTNIKKPSDKLGNDTATSIGSGIYFGYQNLIYGSIENIEKTQNISLRTVVTGGDSQLIYRYGDLAPDLLFEGMRHYLNHQ